MNLCVVIPAFNEEARLPATLRSLARAMAENEFAPLELAEVIVVDDGSSDGTEAEASSAGEGLGARLRVMKSPRNFGKGHAVRTGVLASQSDWVLVADADESTPWSQFRKLWDRVETRGDIAIGSRSLARSEVSRRQSWIRQTMGKTFNLIVRLFTQLPFKDTQCGFKLFRRAKTRPIFESARIDRFAWDVEILMWAERLGLWTEEVPVRWEHKDASRVRMLHDSAEMLIQVLKTRVRFLITRRTADPWAVGFLLAMGLALLPVITGLGLFDLDEALYRHVAAGMKARGDWWGPVWDGDPFFHKPPFFYWAMMVFSRLLGDPPQDVSIAAARLVPWVSTFVTGLFLAWTWPFLYRRLEPRWAPARSPFFPAFVFALGFWPLALGSSVLFDPVQTFALTPALLAATWYFLDGEDRAPVGISWAVFGLSCAAGVAIKGLQALVVPGAAFGLMALVLALRDRNLKAIGRDVKYGLKALAVALAVLAVIFLFLDWKMGRAFTHEFFIEQQFNRASRPFEGHSGFWGFYFVIWALGGGGLTWLAAGLPLRFGRGTFSFRSFPTIWALTFVFFFSAVATKLPNYIWPLWPAFALAVAFTVGQLTRDRADALPRLGATVLGLLLFLVFLTLSLLSFQGQILRGAVPLEVDLSTVFSTRLKAGLLACTAGAGFLWIAGLFTRRMRTRVMVALVSQMLLVGGTTLGVLPAAYDVWSGATERLAVQSQKESSECLELLGPRSAVFSHLVGERAECPPGVPHRVLAQAWSVNECERRGLQVLKRDHLMILCGTGQ